MNKDVDSYSGFLENDKKSVTGLAGYLSAFGISDVYVCGLALDYCVSWTALDSVRFGRQTHAIMDATRGITRETINEQTVKMQDAGIDLCLSSSL
jgi:nicotinamidase/pyrazinamidase